MQLSFIFVAVVGPLRDMRKNTDRYIIVLFFIVFLPFVTTAQVVLDSTRLPIVIINTSGGTIVNEPKIPATMGIIANDNGSYNHTTDPFNDYDGNIGIELRGSSSQALFDKKNYGIELWTGVEQDTSASLLGLPAEEDWVLHGPYSDKSLMRNVLTFELWSRTGWYGSRFRYIELIINNGYKGVYVLMEKIKRDKNRVDISKLTETENNGDDLTGGYIVKLDKFDGTNSGEGWASPYDPPRKTKDDQVIFFQFEYPKNKNITSEQRAYIESYVTEFENALSGSDFRNPITGYKAFIDEESFIDFAIINELNRNVDGYRLSTFLYKDKDSKGGELTLGPIWDFNLAWGNANYCDGSSISGWAWDFNNICDQDFWLIPFWWKRLMADPEFVTNMQNRWTELREGPFADDAIHTYIDSVALILEEPQRRNFQRWNVLGKYIWPNNFVGDTYADEIDYLKDWITDRAAWLDENFASLNLITSIEELGNTRVLVYPNPVINRVTIAHSKPMKTLTIFDNSGKKIQSIDLKGRVSIQLSLENLKEGLYSIKIVDLSGNTMNRKIVKY